MVDGFMSLSPATRSTIIRRHWRLAGVPYDFFRHPAYEGICVNPASAQRLRQKLGVRTGELLIGMLGMIGRYKGTDVLIRAFKALDGNQYRLLIAGSPRDPEFAKYIWQLAESDPRIICKFEQLGDSDFAAMTAACDVLAAPYRDYLHSGSLVYAVSAHRRIITPVKPFVTDLAEVVGSGWFLTYEGKLDEAVLRSALNEPRPTQPPDLSLLSLEKAGERIRAFVERLKACEKHGAPLPGSQRSQAWELRH